MSLHSCFGFLYLGIALLIPLAATTPTWYTASDGNSYLIEADAKYNWLQAHDLCARQGLQLVVIDNAKKNAPFDGLLRKVFAKAPNLWLGHQDEFNKDRSLARPFYDSSTGYRLNYGNWKSGEPNNLNSVESCAHIFANTDFKWNDVDCRTQTFGYICEKHQQNIKCDADLEQKRLKTNQKNTEVSANFKKTQDDVRNILKNEHKSTSDVLLGLDKTMDEIFAESDNSLKEVIKKKPYLEAVIADVGYVVREILENTRKNILTASGDATLSIQHIQQETEKTVSEQLYNFDIVLLGNQNEIDKILV